MAKSTKVIGKLNLRLLEEAFGKLQTDDVVITYERVEHILERHREDYDLFLQYAGTTVIQPDIIIRDCKNVGTVFMIKRLSDTNVNVVVRVALGTDCEGLKNSIMTFYRFRDKNLKKLMKKMKYFTKTNILCKLYIEYKAVA